MHKSPCQYSQVMTCMRHHLVCIHQQTFKWSQFTLHVIASNPFSIHKSLNKSWEREKKRQKEQKWGAQKLTCPEHAWSPHTLCTPCPSPIFSAPPGGAPLLAACSRRQRTVVPHETSSCPGNVHAQVLFNKGNSWQNGEREREKLPYLCMWYSFTI